MKSSKTVFSVILMMLSGCMTASAITQDLALGMTQQEVLSKKGKPLSKNVYEDPVGNVIEEWSYRETTWDDGGWSWDRTVTDIAVVFENNKVKSFGKTGERFKTKNPMSPSLNIDKTVHNE